MDMLLAYWSKELLITNGILLLHLLGSAVVGLLLGYERTYHGRAAGIRTYTLVCMASTLLIAICGYPGHWFGGLPHSTAAADPTRVIQGVMTGVGFLCAGVIMKEGFTIRGLATSASIWMTAVIGIVIGVGFYGAALSATVMTMVVMSGFRKIEAALPHQTTMHLLLVYERDGAPSADAIRRQMQTYGFEVLDWTYHLRDGAKSFEYDLVLLSKGEGDPGRLVDALANVPTLAEFRLSPSRS
jgi:putative Mg2+ transporter-C (MgtC) family protein